MKNERIESRRNFLAKAAAVAAVPAILAIPAMAESGNALNPASPPPPELLTNKLIPSRQNILGTDYVNVLEYPIGFNNDITTALDQAIQALSAASPTGGQILIPHGLWKTNGGHVLNGLAEKGSISIEGVGYNYNTSRGTQIEMVGDSFDHMFHLLGSVQNISIKNLGIKLGAGTNRIGVLYTIGTSPSQTYGTTIENVGFNGGAFGIKVQSDAFSNLDTLMNRFERVSFIGCQTAFYCNTVNSGFTFDNCYFSLPTLPPPRGPGSFAFDCQLIGNLSVKHCIFVGTQNNLPGVQATDGSTILKTLGAFNNISFYDCQDENIHYSYQRVGTDTVPPVFNPYEYVALVYRNCLIQSKFLFYANGSVIFDSCRLGVGSGGAVYDTSTGYVRVFLKGLNNFYTASSQTGGTVGTLNNYYSQVIYESKDLGLPFIAPSPSTLYQNLKVTRGIVKMPIGSTSCRVESIYVHTNSLVFAQLKSPDPNGAFIRDVQCSGAGGGSVGYFEIHLNQPAQAVLEVAFNIDGAVA